MNRRQTIVFSAAMLAVVSTYPQDSHAASKLTTATIATGLSLPDFLTAAPGDTSRVFIVGKKGDIRILNIPANTLVATPFLDINSLVLDPVNSNDERGLLGMAFHPDYNTNGYFYVDYVNNAGNTVVARYTVSTKVPGFVNPSPNIADPASAQIVITVLQPTPISSFTNHKCGWIGFGPNDGYLYIATGDGGPPSGCDPNNRAQTTVGEKLGKILRLDVNTDGFADVNTNYGIPPTNPFVGVTGDDEIWAYGVRNPYRNSFDRATGDLWIADVGQGVNEEVDFQPAGTAAVRNYGWPCNEGNSCATVSGCTAVRPNCTCNDPNFTYPIITYGHGSGACAIVGGYVYRGSAIPDLVGTYFYADYCNGRITSLKYNGVSVTDLNPNRATEFGSTVATISAFGEDAAGEMYMVLHGTTLAGNGSIRKIVRACNIKITGQPQTLSQCRNSTAIFSVTTTGAVNPVHYTWRKDGTTVVGTDSPTLTLVNILAANAGTYRVEIQDSCDNLLISDNATLTVNVPQVGDVNGDCVMNAADVPDFINVLLGTDTTIAHTNRSNMDGMGGVDGNDIAPFIALLLQ